MFEWILGESYKMKKANFEDVQYAIQHQNNYIIINTLSTSEQDCLIIDTNHANQE
jgi:hypothetical protein